MEVQTISFYQHFQESKESNQWSKDEKLKFLKKRQVECLSIKIGIQCEIADIQIIYNSYKDNKIEKSNGLNKDEHGKSCKW